MMESDLRRPADQEAQAPTCYMVSELFDTEARRDAPVEFHSWCEVKENR